MAMSLMMVTTGLAKLVSATMPLVLNLVDFRFCLGKSLDELCFIIASPLSLLQNDQRVRLCTVAKK